jgi:hypothetical protein
MGLFLGMEPSPHCVPTAPSIAARSACSFPPGRIAFSSSRHRMNSIDDPFGMIFLADELNLLTVKSIKMVDMLSAFR